MSEESVRQCLNKCCHPLSKIEDLFANTSILCMAPRSFLLRMTPELLTWFGGPVRQCNLGLYGSRSFIPQIDTKGNNLNSHSSSSCWYGGPRNIGRCIRSKENIDWGNFCRLSRPSHWGIA